MSGPLRRRAVRAVARFDSAVERRVDRVRGNPHLDRVMYAASALGDFSLIWHLVSATRALAPDRGPEHAVRVAAVLAVESALVNGPIKNLFRRHRPAWEQERPRRLRRPRTTSFPSGHASAAMTAAGVLAGLRRFQPSMTSFAITWDYRCPFARNAHEHVITALRDGADWDVRFVPFSLAQVHVAEGEPDVWSRPESDTGLLALQVAVVV